MTKSVYLKNFLRTRKTNNLTPFERVLFMGMILFACDGLVPLDPAYLRSAIFPFDDFSVEAVKTALENICKTLCLAPETNDDGDFLAPKNAVLRSQEKNENKKQEQRKEAKEIKKKEIKKEKNPPFIFPPEGDARRYYYSKSKYTSSVHFKNERRYTQEQLDALVTDVDDIDI